MLDMGETDSQNEGGVGLGLAIVKTFPETHGGRVSVESCHRAGAKFRFSLPGPPQNELTAN